MDALELLWKVGILEGWLPVCSGDGAAPYLSVMTFFEEERAGTRDVYLSLLLLLRASSTVR